jgi:hypothetical protein
MIWSIAGIVYISVGLILAAFLSEYLRGNMSQKMANGLREKDPLLMDRFFYIREHLPFATALTITLLVLITAATWPLVYAYVIFKPLRKES